MIPLAECRERGVYLVRSRNLSLAVFDGVHGFIGIREKFGSRFLDTEYHWERGATLQPMEYLEQLPDEIEMKEYLGSVDQDTRRPVSFSNTFKNDPDINWGWYWADTGKPDPERKIRSMLLRNDLLFSYLERMEEKWIGSRS